MHSFLKTLFYHWIMGIYNERVLNCACVRKRKYEYGVRFAAKLFQSIFYTHEKSGIHTLYSNDFFCISLQVFFLKGDNNFYLYIYLKELIY